MQHYCCPRLGKDILGVKKCEKRTKHHAVAKEEIAHCYACENAKDESQERHSHIVEHYCQERLQPGIAGIDVHGHAFLDILKCHFYVAITHDQAWEIMVTQR